MLSGAVKILNDLQNLFFPSSCLCCNALLSVPQQFLCTTCAHDLPVTAFTHRENNPTERIFYGRIPLEEATSLLWFQKDGPTQAIIHQLKYHGRQKAGTFLGHWLGEEMKASGRFNEIDLVIPIPLHRQKLAKRGFNQTETFARALSSKLGAAYRTDLLKRTDNTTSLTRRSREKRATESGPAFQANAEGLKAYKHILIADDVVTTGRTLESAVNSILSTAAIKVSIATMAITY